MSSLRTCDVFVVGGGPAGLAAAIALRSRGFSVLVADHARPPIDKACGEGLLPDSLEALSALGIDLSQERTGVFFGIRFVRGEESVAADFHCGMGRGLRRLQLHRILLQRAEEIGVQCVWGVRVSRDQSGNVLVGSDTVRSRWLVGADGNGSQVRAWAGLEANHSASRRIAMRQHFKVREWGPYVEIHWAATGQAYVTPVAPDEICLALITRRKFQDLRTGLDSFPELAGQLAAAVPSSSVRGGVTWSRRLKRVTTGNIALIGEASGSVDAITGEGMALAFRQAVALADACSHDDLSRYEAAHREILRLPAFMSRTMLLMDTHPWLQRKAFHSFAKRPKLFERMLSVHVGEQPLSLFGSGGVVNLGFELLTA